MKAYADTSFIVKLVTEEPGSEMAKAAFRRLDYPALYFLPLHALEVSNAIRQHAFHARRSVRAGQRAAITREREAALGRIRHWMERGWLLEIATDFEPAFRRAETLSEKHTERIGCRGFDVLHVALALELECDTFLTADRVQAMLAKAEGLDISTVTDEL